MGKQQGKYTSNKRLKKCKSCGGVIAKNAKTCPHCGERNKKPIYKRVWFWILIIMVIVMVVGKFKKEEERNNFAKETYNVLAWSETKIEEPTIPSIAETTDEIKNEELEETVNSIETESTAQTEQNTTLVEDIIRPEFKSAMDEYEKFFDEYCKVIKKASKSPTDISIMMDYATYTAQYVETMEKFEALENEEMTNAEAIYYVEVSARITQKLLEVSSELE